STSLNPPAPPLAGEPSATLPASRPSSSTMPLATPLPFPSPPKFLMRLPSRRPPSYSYRNDQDMEETFEELLKKYKEIQLELECLSREEKISLCTKGENVQEEETDIVSGEHSIDANSIDKNSTQISSSTENIQSKIFQAFELKPIRQKLLTPAQMDQINQTKEELETESKAGLQDTKITTSILWFAKEDDEDEGKEEEVSELQLRLLALQSASKKWQQKEQRVMKESKEKLMKPRMKTSPKAHSVKKPLIATKQVLRRQKTRAWKKLQQQKEQEKQRREEEERKQIEEEERRKREDEIRKIRDLSNQEEQYNRFMKLVGGKKRSSSKSTDADFRKSQDKQIDESGNLYQYDNYEEVNMDTYLPPPLEPPPPPPLPPEEPEQPPKPPFADEEEEEEMLLREELLKSIANRRATKPEIPRHKSVVVRLDDSDDSDSDNEQSNLNVGVLGGLESMIREARRTAEASKSKPKLKAEKENVPATTAGSLPEGGRKEHRLLKADIVSREKQRLLKTDKVISPSLGHVDVEMDVKEKLALASKQLLEVEDQLRKHKLLLTKDETLLSNLLQQVAKKKEALRQAEVKYIKQKEQLQTAEKIVNANRMLLKKLQEQVHKVQHRVQVKKKLALKFGEELARAKAIASREAGKHKYERVEFGSNKSIQLDASYAATLKKQSFEYIAKEKKRLQQLEYEYRLKIQKLKEAQALRHAGLPDNLPGVEQEPAFVVPQPSLHDLTQDKLVLDSEENDGEDEVQSPSLRERRRSFRESNSFTKPNLKHTEVTLGKESVTKPAKKSFDEPELFLGLNIDDLKNLHAERDDLKMLLEKTVAFMSSNEKPVYGQEIPVDLDAVLTLSRHVDLKPTPFGPYNSPLLVFKSYRFSPYFRNKEKLLISSVSYSNLIEAKQCFCRFDLTGTCNDDECQWQHMRDCTLSRNQLFQDLLSYDLSLVGCTDSSTDEKIRIAAENYVDKQFGKNKDRMTTDEMAVLLVSKVNESSGHTPPFTTFKDRRKWRPKLLRKPVSECSTSSNSDDEQNSGSIRYAKTLENPWCKTQALDTVITPDDVRYFTMETDDIANLETSVTDNPQDVQLWIKLTYKYMNQKEGSPTECLDSALNALARALEINRGNPEIWCHYLNLFSKRGTKEEVQEMCETAVQYAPDYDVWWTYLMLENSFDGKDYVCSRIVQFLTETVEGSQKTELLSFQLLESLLFRVQLSLFIGRQQNALAIFQNALKASDGNRSVAEYLTANDCCLAWLAYIHLIEFNSLPNRFFNPATAIPSKMVNKEEFLVPWQTSKDIKTHPDTLLALFEDAVHKCSDDSLSVEERIIVLHCFYFTKDLCKALLQSCPACYKLLELLADLYLERSQTDDAVNVWLHAFRRNPHNAHFFYYTIKFFISVVCNCLFSFQIDRTLPDLLQILVYIFLYFHILPMKNSLWQSINASTSETVDTFEASLGIVMQHEVVQKIWMDYLVFTSSQLIGSKNKIRDFKLFTDLVNRCLVTVPTRLPIPFSSANYWTNYEFHNQVMDFLLVPKIPSLRHCCIALAPQHEWKEGNIQHLKFQSKMFTQCLPSCLPIWKIAIAVETMLKGQNEVRHLYQRALQKLPLCATLWKDQLLFEASEGGKTDNLRKLVTRCQAIGVSLDELLNLSPSQNRGQ
uniref:Zinc finger C3H1-type containing n=1 Tax=Callorhinchus milii TaxID=7868 RepID=A0A4W3JYY4_CALMI